ncbi:MAG: hypothetical protein N3A61_07040 [Ignavibacteria bacterium]|nr:hypothetical protein [Ignavibacteria bacterium]
MKEANKTLSDFLGEVLILNQPSFWKSEYELTCGETLIGKAYFPKWYRTNCILNYFNDSWEVYKPSLFKNEIHIKELNKELHIATLKKNFWGTEGILELPMGNSLKFQFRLIKGSDEILNQKNERLVLIKHKSLSLKDRFEYYIEKRSELLDKYPFAIFLAWYVINQREHHIYTAY